MALLEQECELSQHAKDQIETMLLVNMATFQEQLRITMEVMGRRMREEIRNVVSLQGPVQEMKVHQSTSAE